MIKRESLRRGSFSTSLLNIIGRAIGFVSVFLISYLFGANKDTDIYYFLLSFTALVTTLFTNLYSSVFLPLFIKIREQESNSKAWDFLNSLFTYTIFMALALGALYYLFAVSIIRQFSNFDLSALILSKDMLLFFAPVITLMILVEFLKTIIQSQYQFTLPALSVLFNSVINILLLILLGKMFGVKIMAVATVLSYLLQFVFLFHYIKKNEAHFAFSFWHNENHKLFFKLSAPIVITQLFSVSSMFYYDYSATMFSAGTLTSIAIAVKIFSLPNDMVISPMSNVVAPVFSENSANLDFKSFNRNFLKYNNIIWLIIVPISCFLIFFGNDVIELLFLRGKFTIEDVQVSGITLKLLSFGLVGYSFHAIATRAFFARQKTLWLSVISLAVSIITILITFLLVKEFGYTGIAVARTISVLVLSVGSSLILLRLYLPGFKFLELLIPFCKMVTAAVTASVVSYFLFGACKTINIFESHQLNLSICFCLAVAAFTSIYAFVCYMLKVEEFLDVFSLLKNKISFTYLKFLKT
jgi:putative peptidoglycan lipid II flippase